VCHDLAYLDSFERDRVRNHRRNLSLMARAASSDSKTTIPNPEFSLRAK